MSSKYGFTPGDEARRRDAADKQAEARNHMRETRKRIDDAVSDVLMDYSKAQGADDPVFFFDDQKASWRSGSSNASVQLHGGDEAILGGEEAILSLDEKEWSGQGSAAGKILSEKTGLPVAVFEDFTVEKVTHEAYFMGGLTTNTPRREKVKKTRMRLFNPDGTEKSTEDL